MKNKLAGFIRNKSVFVVTIAAVVLLVGVGIAALLGVFNSKNTEDALSSPGTAINQESTMSFTDTEVKITAMESDSLGVNPSSAFKLIFDKAPEEQELASSLRVNPEQAFLLKKVSSSEYNMVFEKPLDKDSIYRFILSDKNTGAEKSWAFQTKKSLNIIRTLPRDKAVQVPVNSGIELTFSYDNIENAEKYFEISPKTGGRFELHKKTLVFVPDKLLADTVYTVTVKSGIGVKGSKDTLENDFTFRFQTEAPGSNIDKRTYFSFSDVLYSFTPQSTPALQIYADENMIDKEIDVDLYSYPDADQFLAELKRSSSRPFWAVNQSIKNTYDESKLEKTATAKSRIVSHQYEYWNTTYLLLPSSLPEGYYLAIVEIEGQKYYTQFQVNAASVYILTTKDKSLAWLNNSTTGKPLSGAEVMLDSGDPVKADQNGMAVLNENLPSTSDGSSIYFVVKPTVGLSFIAQVKSSLYQPYYGYYNSETVNNYWTYIYLDKGIYLPEDTINVWGVIKPRDESSSETDAVLELIRYDYSISSDNNASVLTSQKVKILPNGTFAGSLKLSNYNPGSYEVRVNVGDTTILTNYMQIMDYAKPAYKLDVVPDRNFMYAWETVNFSIEAAFYEGTPVSGIKLDYNSYLAGNVLDSGSVISDAAGASRLTFSPTTTETGWRPLSLNVNVSNKEAEEQQINEYSYVTVFPKDTMIEVDTKTEGVMGSATITTSRIDLTKLMDKSSGYYSEDEYRGTSVDMPLAAMLYEKHYEKKATGEYYDYINKVKKETYEYYEVQNLIKEYSFNTANGKYELNYTADKDKSYYLEIYGKDSEGRTIKETSYLYNWTYYYPFNNSGYYIDSSGMNLKYKLDDKVSVEVKYDKEETSSEINNRKYLFIRMKNGVLDFSVSASPLYDFNFDKSLIPNMYVKAVCFDGTNIYDAGLQQYTFDSEEKKLDIKVHSDKESYKPGDTVKLSFEVKDVHGSPCSSDINVSIVDEAYFAVSQQYVDTLTSLYGPVVSSGLISDYFSFKPMDDAGSPMAEGGEGGDMYVRKDFKDSALFTSLSTGNNGKAEASFKLPDNLTSWRVTYQAVTDDLKAGNGKMNLSSKLPFFVDTVFNKNFITGDSPTILVRTYGTELDRTADVNYKIVTSDARGAEKTFSAKGNANAMTEIPLGSFAEGNYTVRVEAVSGKLKDALERSFKVSDSLLETTKTDYINLTDTTVISNNAKGLTSLVFYNEDSSMLYNELHSLYWSWGQRLDQKLAGKIAGELLQKYFDEEIYEDEGFDIKKYQTEDGGLAILSYDSSNPALSAKMCSLAVDYVDSPALVSYFRKLLEDSKTIPEDIAYAYWGLAAMKEPVLLDIRSLLEVDEITPKIKLILGAALAEIGDFQGAQDIYKEAMENTGDVNDTFAWLKAATRDEGMEVTALCSLISLKINAPEKIKLFNYIKTNSTSELLVNLERLIFVTNYIKSANLDSSFNYELDGVKKQVDLQKGSHYRLILTPEKLSALQFTNVQGKIIASSSYVTPVSEVRSTEGSPVDVERIYNAGTGSATSFTRSDTIKITLTPKFNEAAPDGYYEITDILPAGFRFVRSNPGNDNTIWYPDEVTGQKIVFGYYYNLLDSKRTSIVYYARAVSPGIYTADNAAIRHTDSDITGFADKVQITVSK